jgi:hypothetical protein
MVVGRLSFAILFRLRNKRYASARLNTSILVPSNRSNPRCESVMRASTGSVQAVLAAVQREGAPFQTIVEYHGWHVTHADTPIHVESVADRT